MMREPSRPLAGRRIVVTRRPRQAGALGNRLASLGATVVEVPAIEIGAPPDGAPLERSLLALHQYEWMAFTSPNAVDAVRARLAALSRSLPPSLKIASVGRTTTEAFEGAFPGVPVRLEPARDFRAEGLLEAFAGGGAKPTSVLLPVSDRARPELAEGLRRLGATVDNPIAYSTLVPSDLGETLERALATPVDLFLFASPSAVQGIAEALGPRASNLPAVAMGPSTAQAARDAGMNVLAVASPSSSEGLAIAAMAALARSPQSEPSP